MSNVEQLQREIDKLKERNKKVELDKSWETSNTRRVAIAIVTYIFMCIFMYTLEVEKFYISALVPTFGFLLSTFSMSLVRKVWLG